MTVSKLAPYAPEHAAGILPADKLAAIARSVADWRRTVAKSQAEALLASHAAQAERIAELERAELHCRNLHAKLNAQRAQLEVSQHFLRRIASFFDREWGPVTISEDCYRDWQTEARKLLGSTESSR